MKKTLTISFLIISFCSLAQIWEYPNLPFGFENMDIKNGKLHIKKLKDKGIKTKTTLYKEASDSAILMSIQHYDSLGRKIMEVKENDTCFYKYNKENSWYYKKNKKQELYREFVYNDVRQLTKLITYNLITGDTSQINYEYKDHNQLPSFICIGKGNIPCKDRKKYAKREYDGKDRIVHIYDYENDTLIPKYSYLYSGDTIFSNTFIYYTVNDSLHCSIKKAFAIYNSQGNTLSIHSLFEEDDGTIYDSFTRAKYTEDNILTQLKHKSGEIDNYQYNDTGHLIKVVVSYNGVKNKEWIYNLKEW